jgi:hypothetical protein
LLKATDNGFEILIKFDGSSVGNLRKEECSAQTKRQPVVGFNEIHVQATAQDIVETPRETYNGIICDPSSPRIKLGELELPRLKTLS